MAASEGSTATLRLAARRAYELGRLRGALLLGAGAALLALPGLRMCSDSTVAALCLGGFVLAVAAGRVRGEGFDEGARAGALAGILPCLLPAAVQFVDADFCERAFAHGPWLCAAGGLAAGAILALRRRPAAGLAFWSSAILTLALAGSLGCMPAGAMGFAGLFGGVVAGGAPVLALRRAPAV